jgi:hypothetical protein
MNYRPEDLGRNRMKVTQLSTARLPQLLHGSLKKNKKGDQCGEKIEKGKHRNGKGTKTRNWKPKIL